MSWYTEFVADSKEAAVAKLDEQTYMPAQDRAAVVAAIELLNLREGWVLSVKTTGHVGTDGATHQTTVTQMPLARVAAAVQDPPGQAETPA